MRETVRDTEAEKRERNRKEEKALGNSSHKGGWYGLLHKLLPNIQAHIVRMLTYTHTHIYKPFTHKQQSHRAPHCRGQSFRPVPVSLVYSTHAPVHLSRRLIGPYHCFPHLCDQCLHFFAPLSCSCFFIFHIA